MSRCPLPWSHFLGWSEKQAGHPGLWLTETFSTSSLQHLNGIHLNLRGNKISTSSIKFVFFGWLENQDGRFGCRLTDTFSSSPLELLNVIWWNFTRSKNPLSFYNFVFLGGQLKNKDNHLADLSTKVAHCTQVHNLWHFGLFAIYACLSHNSQGLAKSIWRL